MSGSPRCAAQQGDPLHLYTWGLGTRDCGSRDRSRRASVTRSVRLPKDMSDMRTRTAPDPIGVVRCHADRANARSRLRWEHIRIRTGQRPGRRFSSLRLAGGERLMGRAPPACDAEPAEPSVGVPGKQILVKGDGCQAGHHVPAGHRAYRRAGQRSQDCEGLLGGDRWKHRPRARRAPAASASACRRDRTRCHVPYRCHARNSS